MSLFDHEKLNLYQVSLSFIDWVNQLMVEVRQQRIRVFRETLDQLDRASISIVLNIAEGNGKRATKQRAHYFDDARGSAMESAACLDVLVAKRACGRERMTEGKEMLYRVVSMLSKLVDRFNK